MRRLWALFLLVALASTILSLAGDSVEARARRKKVRRRTTAPAAATSTPASVAAPTPPDIIPRRLLVLGFGGRGAQAARGATLAALRKKPSLTVVPLRPSDALKLGTNYGPLKTMGLAKRLNLTAVLYGEVTQEKGKVALSLSLANGEDAQIVGEIAFDARTMGALRTKILTQLWAKLSPLIDQAASPGRAAAPVRNAEGETPERAEPEGAANKAPPPTETPHATEPAPKTPARPRVAEPAKPEGETPEGERAQGQPPAPEAGGVVVVPELGRRKTGSPSEETKTGAGEESKTPGEPPEATPRRCSVADLEPGAGVMFRRFNYRDEQRGALRGFTLYRAPVGRIAGTIYPFANNGPCGLSSGLGLRLAYERQTPVTATLADRRLSTQAAAYQAEVVLRIVRGRLTLQPAVGYYVRQYSVESGVVPSADYRALGAQLDAGVRARRFSFEISAGARRPISVGTLQDGDWFPGLSAFTLSGRAQVGFAATDWIDVLAGGYVEYDSFNFNIVNGGPYPNGVAAGAFDVYLQGLLSVRFRLGLGAPTRL